ncbi:MAG: nucleoside deaminase [Methanolobus sp.]
MQVAIDEAREGMKQNHGGPFGAIIVKNGKIISRAHNEVLKTNDPTAHAEVLAIRRASSILKKFDLSDCEIYTSSQPCPMCLAAIYWARIKNSITAQTRKRLLQ